VTVLKPTFRSKFISSVLAL